MDQIEFQCHFVLWEFIMCIFPSFPLWMNSFFVLCPADAPKTILYFEFIFYNIFWDNFISFVTTRPVPCLHLTRIDCLSVPNGFHFLSQIYQAVLEFELFSILDDKHRHTSGISRVVTSGKMMLSSFLFISMHARVNYLSTPDVILPRVFIYNSHFSFVVCSFFEFGMVSKWSIREWVKWPWSLSNWYFLSYYIFHIIFLCYVASAADGFTAK